MLSIEPNDTIALANFIEFEDSSVEIVTGEIGDTAALGDDVDLFAVELDAGETIFADIDADINGSDLDSVVTIFDAAGTLLVQNDDNSFEIGGEPVNEIDSFQQFTAIEDGTYFIEVSGTGETSGAYSLILSLEEFSADELAAEPNDTIRFANPVELGSEPIVVSGVIGDNSSLLVDADDIDLFEVELEEGETLLADINAEINGSSLDSVLSIFDINGQLLAQNEDNSFEVETGEIVTEDDPFQVFTALDDGTYYVGVSSAGNIGYNPNVFLSGGGESSGFYNLVLSFGDEIVDERTPSNGVGDTNSNDSILDDRSPEDIITDILDGGINLRGLTIDL